MISYLSDSSFTRIFAYISCSHKYTVIWCSMCVCVCLSAVTVSLNTSCDYSTACVYFNAYVFNSFPRHSNSGGIVPYSTLQLISLRAEKDNLVKKFVFKSRPIVDVRCNRRSLIITYSRTVYFHYKPKVLILSKHLKPDLSTRHACID